MVMDSKEGSCPQTGAAISFEMQYEKGPDGEIIYKDCACSEMICCFDFDEEACSSIWIDFFNSTFGTTVEVPAPGPAQDQGAGADQQGYEGYAAQGYEGYPAEGYPAEGSEAPAQGGEAQQDAQAEADAAQPEGDASEEKKKE